MDKGQQQEGLRHTDGQHRAEDEDDFLKRQVDFSNLQTDKHTLVLLGFVSRFGFGLSVSLTGYVTGYFNPNINIKSFTQESFPFL